MKETRFWSLFTIVMVALLSVGMTSCGDDKNNSESDDDDHASSQTYNILVGTWRYDFSSNNDTGYTTMTFTQNGNGRIYEYHKFKDNSTDATQFTFRYEIVSYDETTGIAVIKYQSEYSSSPQTYTITVKNNILVWYDNVSFRKQ